MKVIVSLILILAGVNVFAGAETGHGGGGVECTDANGKVTLVSADLWNGEAHGFKINRTNDISVERQIDMALEKLLNTPGGKSLAADIREHTFKAMGLAKYVDSTDFPIPKDTRIKNLPDGCKLVGIASYKDGKFFFTKNKLKINGPRYEQLLSNTDRAALWIHEGLYKMEREIMSLSHSLIPQRFVAVVFSDEDFKSEKWPVKEVFKAK